MRLIETGIALGIAGLLANCTDNKQPTIPTINPNPAATRILSPEDRAAITPTVVVTRIPEVSLSPEAKIASRNAFKSRLEGMFDFSPDISRQELAGKLTQISFIDKTWGTNILLGTLKSERGLDLIITLDKDGFPHSTPSSGEQKEVTYPRAASIQTSIFQSRNRFLVMYGTPDTINRFQDPVTKDLATKFVDEYFQGVPTTLGVLHLNFLPSSQSFRLEGIGDGQLRNIPPESLLSGVIATSSLLRNSNTGEGVRQDVVVSLPRVHTASAHFKLFSPEEELRITLGNEYATFLPGNYMQRQPSAINEAPSEILGDLAGLDDRWSHLLLGGDTYKEFLNRIAHEMERIGK